MAANLHSEIVSSLYLSRLATAACVSSSRTAVRFAFRESRSGTVRPGVRASRRLTTVLVVRISRSPVRTVCELATLVHHVGCLHAMPWAWRKAHSLRRLRRTLIRRVAPRSRAPPLTLAARPRTTHPSARWAPLRPMPWRSGAPRRRH